MIKYVRLDEVADKMADEEDAAPKRAHEPISMVCFIVIVLATVLVVGAYVNDHIINDTDDTEADTGSDVEMNYTLSFYDYYDNGGAIYQTTVEDIANNSDYTFASGYTAADSYSTFSVTMGNDEVLALFEKALYGAKEGDTVRVTIPAGSGYTTSTTASTSSTTLTVPVTTTMNEDTFSDIYTDVTVTDGAGTKFTSVFGWDAIVYGNGTQSTDVTIVYLASATEGENTYTMYGDEDDEKLGTVTATVNSITDGTINFTLAFSDTVSADGAYSDFVSDTDTYSEIEMIQLHLEGVTGIDATVYVTGISSDGTNMVYRTVEPNYNITLYFVIEIVSVS
jgi:hypothetical protein